MTDHLRLIPPDLPPLRPDDVELLRRLNPLRAEAIVAALLGEADADVARSWQVTEEQVRDARRKGRRQVSKLVNART